jgi:hypothetical protein
MSTRPTFFANPARAKRLALLIDASAQSRRLATATQMEPKA